MRADGVKSFCLLTKHHVTLVKTHNRSRKPVVFEVCGSEGFHEPRPGTSLEHLGADLRVSPASSRAGRLTPASSGTNVIIIHSYLPIDLLSSR